MNDVDPSIADSQVEADQTAVMEHVTSGRPVDPEVARRLQERGENIPQEVFAKNGTLNIAVNLIREGRDEE